MNLGRRNGVFAFDFLTKFSIHFVVFMGFIMLFICPQNSYSKDKPHTWEGRYALKGGGGGLTIEKEGKKLWVEIWILIKIGHISHLSKILHAKNMAKLILIEQRFSVSAWLTG